LDMFFFLVVMVMLTFIRGRSQKAAICLFLPLVAILLHYTVPSQADGKFHLTMLSVGQGESLLVRMPDGRSMLVDGGGYLHDTGRDFGERILAPALFKLGVDRIDIMVMTHSHPDHIGGLPFVTDNFPVGEFWEGAPGGAGKLYERLRTVLNAKAVPVRSLAAGDVLEPSQGIFMTILSPPRMVTKQAGEDIDDMGMNEDSLVFRLSFGATSIMFSADTGFPSENRILRRSGNINSTVLKVGHHGSRFSTSELFLNRVAPEIALISAGHGNNFGLPSTRIVSLLAKRGIRTYRTDIDGTVELVSDGRTWRIATPYRVE
ncbi:MAG: ComEC/Rec2 family competence protein, partial [Deltaproteobacteria bacterium]